MNAPKTLQMRAAIVLCIIFYCGFSAASKIDLEERKTVIEAAIADVRDEIALKESAKAVNFNNAEKKLHSFKMASAESLAQGYSRLKFEKMVKKAESKILKKQRQASVQTAEERVESLAMEFLHTPGSLLTKQEIARIYEESGCREALHTPTDCGPFTQQRSASGVCNNLQNPTAGAANTPMRRLIEARYDDGISRLQGTLQIRRVSIVPGPFSPPNPSPRVVSIGIVQDRPDNDTQFSHILMQWGQFMDHDLGAIPEFEPSECKGCEVEDDTCVPFPVPQDDDDVSRMASSDSKFCLSFRRSLPACSEGTEMEMEPREQLNGLSHFIDGSMVYSHVESVQETMIRNQSSPDGLLNVGPPAMGTTQPSLPIADDSGVVACPQGAGPCFLAGDFRVNEHTALTVMHTIWVREHNRIATILRSTNPQMSSDQIFQTTRNIVIAMIQKITYKDYIPLLLGDRSADLIPAYTGYDDMIEPNLPNSFATAAYRFGHSQLQPFFERLDGSYKSIPAGPLSLVDAFFDTSQFKDNGGTDPILRGLLTKNARLVDEFLNSVLTSRLFSEDQSIPGLDLASLNIQRGRDHGLPSYLTWKQWAKAKCGVESEFRNQLTQIHLLQTYGSLNNVDLFVGGLAEEPLPGGVVGAVFGCIFAKTFVPLRDGDRFYYENPEGSMPLFTSAQREEIEKASLSRVICDNTDIDEVQPNAFMANEERVSCSQLPSVDLNRWSSNELCYIRYNTGNVETADYTAVSRQFQPFRTRVNRRTLEGMQSDCLNFLCPLEGRSTRLILLSSNTCPIQANMNLPGRSRFNNQYRAWISTDDIQSKNGLYTSLGSCLGASNVGVSFCMNNPDEKAKIVGDSDTEKQEAQEVDKFVSDDELRSLLPNNLPMDHLDEIFDSTPLDGNDMGGAQDNSKELIALMEEVLMSLKAQSVEAMYTAPSPPPPPPPPHRDSSRDDHKEASIVELEDALNHLH